MCELQDSVEVRLLYQVSSSTSSSSFGINYEVFLSYRDADTRKGFMDHLYSKLVDAGIEVFKDNRNLSAGEVTKPELKDVIKHSTISIAILSKDYASSKNCLMEMVQMCECRKSNGQTIIPIFYDISPSDVKHLAGDFGRSLYQHEKDDKVNSNTIRKWKEVLQQIGGLRGYERKDVNGRYESQLVKDVLRRVKRVLKKDDQNVTDMLVGIDLHVQKMMTKLGVAYSDGQATKVCGEDVRVVGICGMPGVGKTTLAKVVFNKMRKLFDRCSFLQGITSDGVKFSQEMLIADLQKENCAPLESSGEGSKIASLFSNVKVLIVLDDVHEDEQIKTLAGKLSWFGLGSRIIVTTNRSNVLNGFDGVVEEYTVEPMRHHHALQLFRKHAFQGDAPQDVFEYDSLSIDIVKAIGGLPLSVVLQASRLRGNSKDITIWRNTLESLEKHPEVEVEAAFETSCASAKECASESKQANWSMAFLIFLTVIAFAVVAAGKKRRNSKSSSISSWSSGINYEVFLSFRGEDTRKTFTDHLYSKLVDAGIRVFRDDAELCAGEEIKLQLIEAIKGSKISIAVFSKDYASSKSCLMEVVQMWECRKSNGQTIIPIFYDISPSDVKHQDGHFGRSFNQHVKDKVNADTIEKWKEVFRNIGGLKGFHRENVNGGHESQLVKKVLGRVKQVLKKDGQNVTDKLVGIDFHVHEIMRKLGVVYRDGQAMKVCGEEVRVIGICGMQGVGKTTLAKVVYNKMYMLFGECSFVEDINSEGVVSSQERLIADLREGKGAVLKSSCEGIKEIGSPFRRMKVLIVLDNVRENEQIQALAGELTWFGPGSRIIVTTDRRNVLENFNNKAVEVYKVEPMRQDHALQLFRKHVFHADAPQDVSEYDSLSIDIVKAIGGLPLAIMLTASNLSVAGEEIEIWKETLDFLKEDQEDKVKAAFMNSYDSLDDRTKKIFLDIACFFIGKDKRIPSHMWKACHYYPSKGIKRLREMHLLEIGENDELRMHNLLRDFGRNLVKCKAPCERCRFWNCSDALSILADGNGTRSVEGISLTVEERTVCFTCEDFRKMSNLRYLRLDRAKIHGDTENLPPNLRWIDWRECHLIPELCNMHLKKLVILDLSRSPVTKDSQVWSRIMEKVEELKVLNLQGCVLLGASLDFRAPINLEILILEDCTLLSEIGLFISKMENLSSLNLRKCSLVKQLPQELGRMEYLRELLIDGTGIYSICVPEGSLENLEILSACDCKELKDISTIGRLSKLTSLALDGAKIDWDPETFEFPQNLRTLSLRNCWMFNELPSSIGNLRLLEVMDLSYTGITKMPTSVKHLSNLKTLKMACTHLRKFPEDIVYLEKLEEIDFSGSRSLEGQVRCDISRLSSLRILRLSLSDVAGLPESICRLSRLQTLDILKCNQLHALPKLPSSLFSLHWGSKNMTVSNLSYLTNLRVLCLKDVEQPKVGLLNLKTPKIRWIARLPSLETLELSLPNVTSLPGNFSALTQLQELSLSYMKELDLTQLPSSSLLTLRLKHCKIQEPKFSSLKYLSELELEDCDLAEIDGLKDLKLLEVLKIFQCSRITDLNGLKRLRRLRKVQGFSSALAGLRELSKRVEVDICG